MPDNKKPASEMTAQECLNELGWKGKVSDYPGLKGGELWKMVAERRWYDSEHSICSPKHTNRELGQFREHLRSGGRYEESVMTPHQRELYQQAKLFEGVPAERKSKEDVARKAAKKYARAKWFWLSWFGTWLDRSLKRDPESSWKDGSPRDEIILKEYWKEKEGK